MIDVVSDEVPTQHRTTNLVKFRSAIVVPSCMKGQLISVNSNMHVRFWCAYGGFYEMAKLHWLIIDRIIQKTVRNVCIDEKKFKKLKLTFRSKRIVTSFTSALLH